MNNVYDIMKILKKDIISVNSVAMKEKFIKKIDFLSVTRNLEENTAYVTDLEELDKVIDQYMYPKNILMICTSTDKKLLDRPTNFGIIYVTSDKVQTYSELNEVFRQYDGWNLIFDSCVYEYGTFDKLIDIFAYLIKRPVFLFDENKKLIAYQASGISATNTYIDYVSDYVITFEGLSLCLHKGTRGITLIKKEIILKGKKYLIWENVAGGTPMFYLVVDEKDSIDDLVFDSLAYYLCIAVFKLLVKFEPQHDIVKFSLQSIIHDILEGRGTQDEMIEAKLVKLGIKTSESKLYYLLFARPKSGEGDTLALIKTVHEAIPGIGSYGNKGRCVCLLAKDDDSDNSILTLEKLFEENGYIGEISTESRLSSLAIQYKMLEHIVELREKVYWLANKAIIHMENAKLLCMTDIFNKECAKYYNLNSKDVSYQIIMPSVKKLYDLDMEKGNCFRDVLKVYILSGCSVSETSKRLFMHKNTVLYKLKQIGQLMDYDFKSETKNINILISCFLIDCK